MEGDATGKTIPALLAACGCGTVHSADTGLSSAWFPAWLCCKAAGQPEFCNGEKQASRCCWCGLTTCPPLLCSGSQGYPVGKWQWLTCEPLSAFLFLMYVAGVLVEDFEDCRGWATVFLVLWYFSLLLPWASAKYAGPVRENSYESPNTLLFSVLVVGSWKLNISFLLRSNWQCRVNAY